MGWAGSFILKGTVSQDEFFDTVRQRFAKSIHSIYKREWNEYGSRAEDTLELDIHPLDYGYLRLWLRASPTPWDVQLLCAVVGPHWTEIGVEGRDYPLEVFNEIKQWIAEFYDGFLIGDPERWVETPWHSLELPGWFLIEIPDEKIQQVYDQLTAEWFADKYGMVWPPPFPVGNTQVEANYKPDWSRKEYVYTPPPKPEVKRQKLGSKRQKPHGKRHER